MQEKMLPDFRLPVLSKGFYFVSIVLPDKNYVSKIIIR